jgi:hypothetical protein
MISHCFCYVRFLHYTMMNVLIAFHSDWSDLVFMLYIFRNTSNIQYMIFCSIQLWGMKWMI